MLSKSFRRKIVTAILAWACIICAAAGVFTLLPGRQSVSAEGTEETNVAYVEGTGYTSLQAAINAAGSGDTVTLLDDTEITDAHVSDSRVGVIIGKSLTLDGNGHKIFTQNQAIRRLVWVKNDGDAVIDVTIRDITIENFVPAGRALETRSGNIKLTLENAVLDCRESSEVDNTNKIQTFVIGGVGKNIEVNIIGSSIMAGDKGYAITLYNPAILNITGSFINCPLNAASTYNGIIGYTAITMQGVSGGSYGAAGSKINIDNSVLMAYSPHNDGSNSSFGLIVFNDTNNINDLESFVNVSGNSVLRAVKDGGDSKLAVFSSNAFVTGINAAVENSKVIMDGGENAVFAGDNISKYFDEGLADVTVSGGVTFNKSVDAKYLAENMLLYPAADGAYGVGEKTAAVDAGCAAVIGNVAYKTLKEAVAAADSGDIITVIADETNADGIVVLSGSEFTIDFGGHTYNVTQNFAGSANSKNQAFQLLSGSNITMKNGTITRGADGVLMLIQNYANLTLENMKLYANDSFDSDCEALSVNNGNVTIKGKTELLAKKTALAFDIYYWPSGGYTDGATVTFDDTFEGTVEGKVAYSGDGTDDVDIHDKAVLEINGSGTFNITLDVKDGIDENITANGGKFNFPLPKEYLGEGAALYTDGAGNYEVALATETPADMEKVAVIMNGAGYATIEKAIAAAGSSVIALKLYDDLVENVFIDGGKTVILDLNGKKITDNGGHTITNRGTLTVKGSGTVDNTTPARGALFNLGTATLLGGKYVRSKEDSKTNSWYAIKNLGHLTVGEQDVACPVQVIQDGNFSSLLTNGYADADDKADGDYVKYSEDVTTADKIPTLVINGGTFSGGLNTVKNDNHGIATINGGSFVNNSQATVLNWNVLTVTGGTFNQDGKAPYALITSYDNSDYNNGITEIKGGSFTGRLIADYNPESVDYSIYGGTFSTMPKEKFFETGYAATWDKEKQAYVAGKGTFVASVGEYSYTTLQQAINAAADGNTVILLSDVVENVVIPEGKTVTLDLNGKKITDKGDHTITNYGTLTVTGSGTVDNTTHARGALFNLGTATLLGGEYVRSEEDSKTNSWYAIKNLGHLTVGKQGEECHVQVIQNGNFSSLLTNGYADADDKADGDYDKYYDKVTTADKTPTLVINGGTFSGGLNTVKNDNHGIATISGGSFVNSSQAAVLNWNELTVTDGTFNQDGNAPYALITSYDNSGYNNGKTIIEGGSFTGTIIADYNRESVEYSISGGTFNGAVDSENTGYITGGMFKELPADTAFAEGLEGELYNGYYLVVNAEEAGAAPSLADRLSAQSELRGYLAAFGLTVADMQTAAASDGLAADIVAGYEDILAASTKDDVAKALAAAMDAADAYKLGLDFEKAAAITELTEYAAKGAEGEGLAIVVVPTYAISAINAAVTADEIRTYVDAAKAEMDDIRARRYEAEAQLAEVNERFTAIMQALGITGSAENGYSSKVLENLNGVIEALGITETGGEWSTNLLNDITSKIETANENITAIRELLGTATGEETAQTLVDMIKATQGDIAKAEENIEKLINELSLDISDKLGSLTSLVQSLPDKATVSALTEQLSKLGSKVDTMNTTVSGIGTDIGSLDTAVKTLTEAQTMLAQTVENYKSAVETMLGDLSTSISGLRDMLGGESGLDAIIKDIDEAKNAILGTAGGEGAAATGLQAVLEAVSGVDGVLDSAIEQIGLTLDTLSSNVSGVQSTIDKLGIAGRFNTLDKAIAAVQEEINANTGSLSDAVSTLTTAINSARDAIIGEIPDYTATLTAINDRVVSLDEMLGGESGLDAIKGELDEVLTALGTATDGDTLFGLLNTVESGNTAILTAISELRTTLTGTLGDIQADLNEAAAALGTVTGALAKETGWVSEDIAAAKAEIDKIAAAVGSFGSEDGDLATQIGEVVTALENVQGTVGSIAESVNASTAVEEVKNNALTDIETWLNAYVDNILGANGEQQARSGGIVTFAVTEETTEGDVYAKLVQAFDEKNAQLVLKYYNDALTAIDSATTVSEVTTAVAAFKAQVASVEAAAGNATDVNLTGVYVLLAILLAAMVAAIVIMLVKNRRQPAEQTAAPAPVQAAEPAAAQVTESVSVQPEATVTAEEETAATDDDKERVVITANVRTFSEAYDELSEQSREMFNKVREYSLTKDNAVELRQSTGICVKRNGKQIVKLTVRRNAPVAMFYLENEMLKDFRRESDSRPKLKVHATELTLREEADLEAAYRMVDLSVEQIDKDIEAKKERARELRRLRRQQKAAQKGNENNLT